MLEHVQIKNKAVLKTARGEKYEKINFIVVGFVLGSKFCFCNEKKDLIVFAAASMTETLSEIKADYEKSHKNINLVFNFDSSGTLLKQIQAGADCDVFLSAAQKQMNTLENEGKLKNESRKNLLENKTVLAVHPDNQKGLKNQLRLQKLPLVILLKQ